MAGKRKTVDAIGYMRTSSATNVGEGKDSEARQRKAIEGYAKSAGFVVVEWFYDKAIRGADAITERPGFAAMLGPDRRQRRAHHHCGEPGSVRP
jgi:DNA invertase Pin-like site-specific DNA recombinase